MARDAIDGGNRAMVTIGTDGFVDYVQVPDGQRFMLGPVSVLKMISSLAPARHVRAALDAFLTNKQVMLSVDLDRMWSLMPFRRARYSSTNPLMGSEDRTQSLFTREKDAMAQSPEEVFSARLARLEEQVSIFESYRTKMASASVPEALVSGRVASLKALVGDLRTAGLPPEFLKQQEKMKEKSEGKKDDDKDGDKEASFDLFKTNMNTAESIVAAVTETDKAIDRLVQAGKRFDSVRAKADLHKIASRVTEIAQSVDLACSWVGKDLAGLSKRASEIRGLFVPAQPKEI